MIARLSIALSALIAIEDIWVSMKGGVSVTGAGGSLSAGGIFGKYFDWMDKPIGQLFSSSSNPQQKVVIEFKGEGAEKLIEAKIHNHQQAERSFQMQRTTE
jgi:hypothetical protein